MNALGIHYHIKAIKIESTHADANANHHSAQDKTLALTSCLSTAAFFQHQFAKPAV